MNLLLEGTDNVEVRPITKEELPQVKEWILKKHYIGRWPTAVTNKLGVYVDGKLSGCLLYGATLHPQAGSRLFKNKDGQSLISNNQCRELLRAFTTDEIKKQVDNLGSIVVAKGNEFIRNSKTKDGKPIKAILSYADPEVGHKGTVYKATNAVYLGKQTPAKVLVVTDPTTKKSAELHQMSLKPYGTTKVEKLKKMEPFKGKELKWEKKEGKHKYLYTLGKDQKEKDVLLASLTEPLLSFPDPDKPSVEIPNPARERLKQQAERPNQHQQKNSQPQDKRSVIKSILRSTVMNPETGHKILVQTALSYDKQHPSYKQAMGMVNALSKKHGIRIKSTR